MTPKKTQKTPQEDPKSTQASAEDISTGDNVDENEVTEKGFKGQQSKAMNSMGAYHQEENTEMDANQLSMVLNSLSLATQKKDKAAEKIAIKKEDLEVVMRELELTQKQGEKLLKEAKGDLATCLRTAIQV